MDILAAVARDQLLQLVILLCLVAALLDLAVGVTLALRRHEFSLDRVAHFLGDHVLVRVIPIAGLAAFGSFVGAVVVIVPDPPATLAPLGLASWAAAWAGLAAYLGETARSLMDSAKPPA